MEPKKIIAIDFSEVFFTSVFSKRRMGMTPGVMDIPLEFMVLKKIFSYMKAFPGSDYYLMCDGVHSWRKDVYPDYKAQRKEQRDKYEDLDWADIFARYGSMISSIDMYTPINTYRDDNLEADDLEAVLAKDGRELIIFSSDKDLNQLMIYPNVKLISPKIKKVKNKFVYKEITNPMAELDKLVMKGDRCDNIPRATTEAQKIINNKIANLINLPPVIEDRCRAMLYQKRQKDLDIEKFKALYKWQFVEIELKRIFPDYAL